MEFTTVIKEAGPYTAPLCVAMAWAMRWLADKWARCEVEKKSLQIELNELRDRRASDLANAAKEHAEIGEATRFALREHTAAIEAVLKAQRGD